MTNNNWIEQFDDIFYEEVNSFMGTAFGDRKLDESIKNFISNLLTQKDQEHKAELESIKGEIEKLKKLPVCNDERYFINIELSNAISILNNHINKLSTE